MEGIEVHSPEILWHGGGNEAGKPDPVFAVDFHPRGVLATAGIDENVPPKGSVRLWKVDSSTVKSVEDNFLLDLSDHQTAVNVCRFSPNGLMLASASDRQIVVYSVKSASEWGSLKDVGVRGLERTWLRPSLDEIRDLQWSPDSTFIIAGSIDNKAEIMRVETRDSLLLHGHKNYVQGVAWDPLNTMVVTQSADRTVKTHQLKFRPGAMARLAPRGHCVAKMHLGYDVPEGMEAPTLSAADFGINEDENESSKTKASASKSKNLYADSTVPSFFRRPCFSPDGNLLITPTGIHRSMPHPKDDKSNDGLNENAAIKNPALSNSFCTHIYSRDHLVSPIISLVGLEDPSVSVRCSPILYKLIKLDGEDKNPSSLIKGDYRMLFAVVTISAVYIYDTQHSHPLARLGGLHLACINDVAWSCDGNMLVVCSSDGYLSFITFAKNSLGEELDPAEIPVSVKTALPCLYNFTPPPIVIPEKSVKNTANNGDVKKDAKNVNTENNTSSSSSSVTATANVVEPSTGAASEDLLTSKRKRITQDFVGSTAAGLSTLNSADEPGTSEISVINSISSSTPVSSLNTTSTSTGEKKKKRITPTTLPSSSQ